MEKNEFYNAQNKLLEFMAKELTDYIDWEKLLESLEKKFPDMDVRLLWNTTRKYKTPTTPAWSKKHNKND